VNHKGKHIHGKDKEHKPAAGNDFFGFGDAIRAALIRRLPQRVAQALDVGTGFGRNAIFLARHLPPGSQVWSIDPSEESLKRGEAAVREAGHSSHVSFRLGSAEQLPFDDEQFDLTMGVMLFHHLVQIPPALREMARVTKSGGKVLVVDWGPTAHLLPFAIQHRVEDFSTPRTIERMLLEAGLEPDVEQHPAWYVVEGRKA